MLLLIVLCAGVCAVRGVGGTFIALRDPHFTGEDKRLGALLTQRIDPRLELGGERANETTIQGYLDTPPLPVTDMSIPDFNVSASLKSGRRTEPKYLQDYALHLLILDLMRGSIYRLREKVKDLERVFTTYEKDPRFRIGYLFSVLAQWEKEARAIHQHDRAQERELTVQRHLYYYEQILRRQVDVTYSLQLLYTLHQSTASYIRDHLQNLERLKTRYSVSTPLPQAG